MKEGATIGNNLENLLRTHMELDGNNKNPNTLTFPPKEKMNKNERLGCMLPHLIGYKKKICGLVFFAIFGLG